MQLKVETLYNDVLVLGNASVFINIELSGDEADEKIFLMEVKPPFMF